MSQPKLEHKSAHTVVPIAPLIANRWSGRAFEAQALLSDEQVLALLEAARWAPSYYGEQPWRFLLWDKKKHAVAWHKALLCLVEGNQIWAKNASLLLVACAYTQSEKTGQRNHWAEYDTGAAVENLCLQATNMGLMAHQMGGFDADRLRTEFDIPAVCRPMAMVAIGVPTTADILANDTLREKELAARQRHALSHLFFSETWGHAVDSSQF